MPKFSGSYNLYAGQTKREGNILHNLLLFNLNNDVLWDEQHHKSNSDEEGDNMYDVVITHEQIQQMFTEESDDDEFFGFESIC